MRYPRIGSGKTADTPFTQDGNRSAAFRRAHHVGQILHGKVLRWVRGGKAWVHVGGQELLADLQTTPEAGVSLRFLVVQLLPDILLKEIGDEHDTGSHVSNTLSAHDAVRAYLLARDALDTLLQQQLWPTHALSSQPDVADLQHQRVLQTTFIAGDARALSTFVTMHTYRNLVNRVLQAQGNGTLFHLPWLLPNAKGVEMLKAQGVHGTMRLTFGAALPRIGRTLIQCLAGTERIAYRLFLEHADHAARTESLCSERDGTIPDAPTCLGCGPLPAGMHDVLSSVLRTPAHGGLHVRA